MERMRTELPFYVVKQLPEDSLPASDRRNGARKSHVQFWVRGCLSQFLHFTMLMELDSENSALSSSIRLHPSSKNWLPLFHAQVATSKDGTESWPKDEMYFFLIHPKFYLPTSLIPQPLTTLNFTSHVYKAAPLLTFLNLQVLLALALTAILRMLWLAVSYHAQFWPYLSTPLFALHDSESCGCTD